MQKLFNCHIKTSVLINAPVSVVWDVLVNFQEYPVWNPFLKSLSGKIAPNEQIKVIMHPAGGGENTFYPRLETMITNTSLTWVGKMADYGCMNLGALFSGNHYFHLEEQDENVTYLRHGEEFSGALIWALSGQLETIYHDGFAAMNTALKDRSEKIHNNEDVPRINRNAEVGERSSFKNSRDAFFASTQNVVDPTKRTSSSIQYDDEGGFKPKL
jgi:hypothetical protein